MKYTYINRKTADTILNEVSMSVTEMRRSPGKWVVMLKNPEGEYLSTPFGSYASKEEAEKAIEIARAFIYALSGR